MYNPELPLVELHRHLDGNIRPQTIWELAQQHNIALPVHSLDELIPLTQIQTQTADLLAFLARLDYGVSVLADTDACYRVAYENMQDAKNQGLDYVELRFSPFYMARAFKLNLQAVIEAVYAGVKAGEHDTGVKVQLIGILSRTFGLQKCQVELDALLACRDKIIALDLAGDELGFPATLFESHFKLARDAGWHISVHAGEADGPQSIWDAINLLGAERIGHGVAAIHDQPLMQYMAQHKIAIEACPTSNYHTATVTDTANHPLKIFVEQGMCVTLSTDDPAVSNIDLAHEYNVAKQTIGLSDKQLNQIQLNALDAAFLSENEKTVLRSLNRRTI
ncbi:adenosine deaminase [Neptunicella marina]|uniref:adenosine deaminase n=1 Tax=Neptunicella marina TaxID=2125989 RepID=A0A8J6IS39_9ALTE|nr:adenosine deaminase [Neptunicella marina]MBC3764398.1 adenosine deaminase [Neptunicella marina]